MAYAGVAKSVSFAWNGLIVMGGVIVATLIAMAIEVFMVPKT